jgi:hypothetical protein
VGRRVGLDSAENLAPTGIRFPVRPALSQSLYRLSYLAHGLICTESKPSLGDAKCSVSRHEPQRVRNSKEIIRGLHQAIRNSGNSANYCGVRKINLTQSVKLVWQRDIISLELGGSAEK